MILYLCLTFIWDYVCSFVKIIKWIELDLLNDLVFASLFLLLNNAWSWFLLLCLLFYFYSSKGSIPLWPFVSLSFFGGVYALLPYFVLWKPPAPPVEETQLKSWPLNFLESKVTAIVSAHLSALSCKAVADR